MTATDEGWVRSIMMMADEDLMRKQVEETHASDSRELEVEPLLNLVEDILVRATTDVDTDLAPVLLEKALTGGEAHETTLSILQVVAHFPWDAKPVLTLAAFAFNYGQFWLLNQVYSSNQLAKPIAILKQLPVTMESMGALESRLDKLNSLIQAMLEVTGFLADLKELSSAFGSKEVPALSAAMAPVPVVVYWTIRSAVSCASQITNFTSFSHEYITSATGAQELSTLDHKLKSINEHFPKQIIICHRLVRVQGDAVATERFDEAMRIDNMKILKFLIYPKDDILPLVDGTTEKRVNIEVLKGKKVWLLISELDISQHELSILKQIHSESKLHETTNEIHQHEMVWIPMVDHSVQWTKQKQKQFEVHQSMMPWYTVCHPRLISKVAIQFVEEKWHFRNKPILVVLDQHGKVVCPNAIHMMWIWGSIAFPFTKLREEDLWKEQTWTLELLVTANDQTILNWIRDGKYIFLYGGDDIEWLRKFTVEARQVAQGARIPLEMVYVGKSIKREQAQHVITTINNEKLSHTWQDPTMVWLFWTRLESMLFSKIQLGKVDEHNPMMQQIKRLLSFDKAGGWAMLSRGSTITMDGHGTTVLPALLEYDLWKENVATKGYGMAFKEHHDKIQDSMHLCCRLDLQSTVGEIPASMRCPDCQSLMEELTTFFCRHDEEVPRISE
ncbi:protein SIEVE ELEMENT OCCLUSION B-like [Eucalyptus grandis]|uniref:protein SIEVE ELEMENT OCCLUSION B-like n=1 Tax=Eucalyptus grandis TaxID=71139 RepID=UPI00192EB119|nr:protein SIEVE ELEMENT OCCLUSION B-like [Eucalyptus grandis]